jgi:hypothetical protein
MALDTRVNIINDSSKRVKVKIDNDRDRNFDEIINIEPGGRLDGIQGSVSGAGNFDVIVDIITNPIGPDNNTRLGGFKFDNPAFSRPNVRSDVFTTARADIELAFLRDRQRGAALLTRVIERSESRLKTYWGKLDGSLIRVPPDLSGVEALLINSAPKPTFTIEAFFNDSVAGAKVWDLRINSDNFAL